MRKLFVSLSFCFLLLALALFVHNRWKSSSVNPEAPAVSGKQSAVVETAQSEPAAPAFASSELPVDAGQQSKPVQVQLSPPIQDPPGVAITPEHAESVSVATLDDGVHEVARTAPGSKRHLSVNIRISPEGAQLVSTSYLDYVPKQRDRLSAKDTHLIVVRNKAGEEVARTGVSLEHLLYWDAPSGAGQDSPGRLTGGVIRQETFEVYPRLPVGDNEVVEVACYALPGNHLRHARLNDFDLAALTKAWTLAIPEKRGDE